MKENVFAYDGTRGELADLFYRFLITGKVVTYEDILTEYDNGSLSTPNVTGHPLYTMMKQVGGQVIETFQKYGFTVLEIPDGRTKSFQYIGSNKNPLGNIRFKALLYERHEQLSECIKNQQAVKIAYKPFDRKKMRIIFHPHLLYTYNGRQFAFGVSEMEGKPPRRRFIVALDRIEGEILGSGAAYIQAEKNEYGYLAHLIGVTMEEGATLTSIRIRAYGEYTFGLITTKPFHDSQRVLQYPDWRVGRDYGDVEIEVYPNRELIGNILHYGSKVSVIEPETIRQRILVEIGSMANLYPVKAQE